MAFPVVPEEALDEFPKDEKKPVKEFINIAAKKTISATVKIADFILLLTVSFWYYFFTGLAIVLNRNVPKEWLKMGTSLGMSRVSSHIKKASQNASSEDVASENTAKRHFKVVDIDTKKPFKPLSINKTSKKITK
jgi:hypothetical protein